MFGPLYGRFAITVVMHFYSNLKSVVHDILHLRIRVSSKFRHWNFVENMRAYFGKQ